MKPLAIRNAINLAQFNAHKTKTPLKKNIDNECVLFPFSWVLFPFFFVPRVDAVEGCQVIFFHFTTNHSPSSWVKAPYISVSVRWITLGLAEFLPTTVSFTKNTLVTGHAYPVLALKVQVCKRQHQNTTCPKSPTKRLRPRFRNFHSTIVDSSLQMRNCAGGGSSHSPHKFLVAPTNVGLT